jgi:hypothetical protein
VLDSKGRFERIILCFKGEPKKNLDSQCYSATAVAMLNQKKLYNFCEFFPKPGFLADFLYILLYIINLAGRQLYISTWDEEWSCEAAMGRVGARSAPFLRINELRKTGASSTAKPHKIQRMYEYTSGAEASWKGWRMGKLAENLQGAPKQNWRTYISAYCPVMTYGTY